MTRDLARSERDGHEQGRQDGLAGAPRREPLLPERRLEDAGYDTFFAAYAIGYSEGQAERREKAAAL